jgi:hypothetical protein
LLDQVLQRYGKKLKPKFKKCPGKDSKTKESQNWSPEKKHYAGLKFCPVVVSGEKKAR